MITQHSRNLDRNDKSTDFMETELLISQVQDYIMTVFTLTAGFMLILNKLNPSSVKHRSNNMTTYCKLIQSLFS